VDLKGSFREQISWFLAIDAARCLNDRKCVEFCTHGVYRRDKPLGRPVVVAPYHCLVGCDGCADICPPSAISFPSLEWLKGFLESRRAVETGRA